MRDEMTRDKIPGDEITHDKIPGDEITRDEMTGDEITRSRSYVQKTQNFCAKFTQKLVFDFLFV
jgi:hypothetical protein